MNKKTKICHLTSVHKPFDVRIFHKECTSLAKKYDVTLLVVNGVNEVKNNVKIINVPVEFSSRIQRFTKAVNEVYKKAIEIDADVYHLHDPELLRIALKLQKKGKKVIFDAHEDLPRQLLSKPYLNKYLAKTISILIEKYENYITSKLSGVITATPYIKDRFIKINSNTENINNYPILDELKAETDSNNKPRKNVSYVGGISVIRGINEMLESLNYTEDEIKLELAGFFSPESLEKKINKRIEWRKVVFHGFVDRKKVIEIYSNCFAGLVVLHPTRNYIDSLPIKMFEYMSAGIPVIASNFPLWKKIIEENNCGICVNPEKPKEIADAINYLSNNRETASKMGDNGKKAVLEKYNWSIEENKLLEFYKNL